MQVIEGGGFSFLTDDPILIAVVKRCDELQQALKQARYQEVARYRTLRRDITTIKRAVQHKVD